MYADGFVQIVRSTQLLEASLESVRKIEREFVQIVRSAQLLEASLDSVRKIKRCLYRCRWIRPDRLVYSAA